MSKIELKDLDQDVRLMIKGFMYGVIISFIYVAVDITISIIEVFL